MQPQARLKWAASALNKATNRPDLSREHLVEIRVAIAQAELELFGPKPKAKAGEGARVRILEFLLERIGTPVAGEALRELTGIQEWARRVRELRVEHGYDVIEASGMYTLVSAKPDSDAAERWEVAHRIRNLPGSGEYRILEYLKARVGQIVTSAEIIYVAKISSAPRRARQLRDESGYRVSSNKTRADLRPDQYVLETLEPLPASERKIKPSTRDAVLERDGFRCRLCGAVPAKGVWLEVDHILEKAEGGSDEDLANLQTLCHDCHAAKTGKYQKSRKR